MTERTSLTRYAPLMRDPDEREGRRRAAQQWHEDGTVILFPDVIARMSWEDREFLQRVAAKFYGKRKG